jgi:hypothetical protein
VEAGEEQGKEILLGGLLSGDTEIKLEINSTDG